ncbi:hypothetical protein [Chryseosolibacter indicus]|uniref:Phosphate ABC transporter substrate-binding protein n=1 Tax=Chryseosolibacter indicus TaxID=2782351 RepID=A0ABS5VSC1_9BACT|nr:hypothetical protein [Chryseosolibacter indicus]MBT1703928.1 hypothetical protein [Chryseosolibacter indicus]
MKSFISFLIVYFLLLIASASFAQSEGQTKKVVITGARFTYPLLQKWINEYKEVNPSVEVIINPRTTSDPASYDLLIEAYQLSREIQEEREVISLGRYALLPIANSKSHFAKTYEEKGLDKDLLKQIFFHDIYTSKEKQKQVRVPYTVYTRLQKAGPPITFAKYFGYEQQNIKGNAIAGADEHLIKALLKDSTAVSYNNLGLIYNTKTKQVIDGLTILPVDLDDNGRITNDEKIYSSLDNVLAKLESEEVKNVPIADFHLSIKKRGYNADALKFLLWVIYNGQDDLNEFGFLKPDLKRFSEEKQKFEHLTRK